MERRQSLRLTSAKTVTYGIESEGDPGTLGVVYNYSSSGFALLSGRDLSRCKEIIIKRGLDLHSGKKAKIRWAQKVSDDLYKAGVSVES